MRRLAYCAFLLFVSSALCFGQSWRGKGRLEGSVKDPDGKPIVGATVKLTCAKYGGSFEVKSDDSGKWVASGIRGSDWFIDIGAKGYMLKQLSNYISEVNRNKPVDVVLELDPASVAGAMAAEQLAEAQQVLSKGNELFNQGKFPEALVEYQAILVKNPDLNVINVNIANCYYEMKQVDKAIETLQQALQKDPAATDIMIRLGNLFAENGNLEKAMEYFGKIDQNLITNPITFYNIGVLLFNNGKAAEAQGYFQNAVRVDPNYADGYFQLGLCHVNAGDLVKAKESFNKFLSLAPADHPNVPNVQAIMKTLG